MAHSQKVGLDVRRDGPSRRRWAAAGIFLVALSVYIVSSPGRIDMVDGQIRYDVAQNLLKCHHPYLTDPALFRSTVLGWDGCFYSHYGAAASVLALPLVWIGKHTRNPLDETSRFLFSLNSCLWGALAAVVLYLFYLELSVPPRAALAWTMVSSFATLLWPLSTSTFDNAQHAFFALAAVFLAFLSARQSSIHLALVAGAVAGILIVYQMYFIILMPALALAVLAGPAHQERETDLNQTSRIGTPPSVGGRDRVSALVRRFETEIRDLLSSDPEAAKRRARFKYFLEAASLGLTVACAWNILRFGGPFKTGQVELMGQSGYTPFGNPLAGLLTLMVSPGKSIFLYSPPIILGLVGIRRLLRSFPYLGWTVILSSIILLLFLSSISFAGGDWCWGPRYLTPLVALWALAFPFVPVRKFTRRLIIGVVTLGFVVQLLGLSVDHQRFFLYRCLPDYFWVHPWSYFRTSALFARPAELISVIRDPVPATAKSFSPSPYGALVTYCIFGTSPDIRRNARTWMRNFMVFYLARPWPIWMWHIDGCRRPISVATWMSGCFAMFVLGVAVMYRGL